MTAYPPSSGRPHGHRETAHWAREKPDIDCISAKGLKQLVAPEALITTEDERRAFETDAPTAYQEIPLAVVLPSMTQQVCAVLRFCRDNSVKVVARGAGTSLAGGVNRRPFPLVAPPISLRAKHKAAGYPPLELGYRLLWLRIASYLARAAISGLKVIGLSRCPADEQAQ